MRRDDHEKPAEWERFVTYFEAQLSHLDPDRLAQLRSIIVHNTGHHTMVFSDRAVWLSGDELQGIGTLASALYDDAVHESALRTALVQLELRRAYEQALSDAAARAAGDWYARIVYVVPKSIREPWLGDLREDRQQMAEQGAPRLWIEVCTACQLALLAGRVLWTKVLQLVDVLCRTT